jgi:hypothetical protein
MLAMKSVESQRHDDVPFHLPQRARGDVTRWEQVAFGCKKWCGDGALSRPPGGRERAWRPRVIEIIPIMLLVSYIVWISLSSSGEAAARLTYTSRTMRAGKIVFSQLTFTSISCYGKQDLQVN